jgi:hypothetical protein
MNSQPDDDNLIYVGIDDTDVVDSPGTNQIARAIAELVAPQFECLLIVRHQLLSDPRVPYTSKNGSASLHFRPRERATARELADVFREELVRRSAIGSDPGLCVAERVGDELIEFGRRCQQQLVAQREAIELAGQCGVLLEGLGGTCDGVIGALAAVGLAAGGNDGRIVQLGRWTDDLSGPQSVDLINRRGIAVRRLGTDQSIGHGKVDVGKKLRPNRRDRAAVLYVAPAEPAVESTGGAADGTEKPCWQAVRLT